METTEENSEMIWKIQKKSKLKWYGKYRRKVSWNDMENMEKNCEMILKIQKKG